jgi:hypothetical protein
MKFGFIIVASHWHLLSFIHFRSLVRDCCFITSFFCSSNDCVITYLSLFYYVHLFYIIITYYYGDNDPIIAVIIGSLLLIVTRGL